MIAKNEKMITKKRVTFLLIVIFCMLILAIIWEYLIPHRISIDYIGSLDTNIHLPIDKDSKSDNCWFIISSKQQHQYWLEEGLNLPPCDYSRSYLIISRYKMTNLYYYPHRTDDCVGAPVGHASIDSKNSSPGKIYMYKMPIIFLAQGVG